MQNIALYMSPTISIPQVCKFAVPSEGISKNCLKYSQFNIYSNANSLEKALGKTWEALKSTNYSRRDTQPSLLLQQNS